MSRDKSFECHIHDAMFPMLAAIQSNVASSFKPVAYVKLFFLLQGWDLQNSKAPNSMKIVLFADFVSSNHGLNQAQYMLKQLCNEGHQITLFGE